MARRSTRLPARIPFDRARSAATELVSRRGSPLPRRGAPSLRDAGEHRFAEAQGRGAQACFRAEPLDRGGPQDLVPAVGCGRPPGLPSAGGAGRGLRGEKYLVDESAIILPREDLVVDLDEFARRELLLTINGVGLASPQDPKPGLAWKARAGTTEIAPGNGRIADAARLARFLVEKLRDVDRASHPALKFLYINPMDQHKKYRGLFLWNPDEKISVLWGDAPGTEDPGIMSAEEKWRKIYDWSRNTSQPTLPDGRYWEITDSGLIEAGIERYPPQSARSVPPPLDARTILTKVPGQSP